MILLWSVLTKLAITLPMPKNVERLQASGFMRAMCDYTESGWWRKVLTLIGPSCMRKLSINNPQQNESR